MDNRSAVAATDCFDGSIKHRVHEFGVWSRTDRPTDHEPIEAINNGRQIDLAGRNLELRDVCEPLFILCRDTEVTVDKVFQSRTYFSSVEAVSTSPRCSHAQLLLLHQAPNDLLRDEDFLPAKCCAHSAISVAAVIQFKDIRDGKAYTRILVGSLYLRPVIEVGATGEPQFSKKLRQRVSLFHGINQRRLLPIRQELRVDAQASFIISWAFFRMSCSIWSFRMSRRSDSICRSSVAFSEVCGGSLRRVIAEIAS